jgi:hypothetical protein
MFAEITKRKRLGTKTYRDVSSRNREGKQIDRYQGAARFSLVGEEECVCDRERDRETGLSARHKLNANLREKDGRGELFK